MGQQPGRDAQVIINHVELGELAGVVEDLVGIRDRNPAVADLQVCSTRHTPKVRSERGLRASPPAFLLMILIMLGSSKKAAAAQRIRIKSTSRRSRRRAAKKTTPEPHGKCEETRGLSPV